MARRRWRRRVLTVAVAALAVGAAVAWRYGFLPCGAADEVAAAPATAPADVRVMTFNILSSRGDRHVGKWEDRKGLVLARIRAFDPDLFGAQEVTDVQAADHRHE